MRELRSPSLTDLNFQAKIPGSLPGNCNWEVFIDFSMVFHGFSSFFHGFLSFFHGFSWFSMVFHHFSWFFIIFHGFFMGFHHLFMVFHHFSGLGTAIEWFLLILTYFLLIFTHVWRCSSSFVLSNFRLDHSSLIFGKAINFLLNSKLAVHNFYIVLFQ